MGHVNPRPRTYLEVHGRGLDKVAYFVTPGDDQAALPSRPSHSGMPPISAMLLPVFCAASAAVTYGIGPSS